MIYLAYKSKHHKNDNWDFIELSDDLSKARYLKHKWKKEWFEPDFTYEGISTGRWCGTFFDFKVVTKKQVFVELL